MRRRWLKWLRVAAALFVAGGLVLALVDFRGLVPSGTAHLRAVLQLVPALVSLASGAALAHTAAAATVLLLTLALGRVYCSVICPLGLLQDAIIRLAGWLRRGRNPAARFAPARTWLRHVFLCGTVVAVLAGAGGVALALLDPYSAFGRIAVDLFRPVVTAANNLLVGPAGALGLGGWYRVNPQWVAVGALVVPVVTLVLVATMAALRGRLYCNTVCPVGTALGLLSRRAAFRLQIQPGACRKCAACLGVCKAQCIDLRGGAIDFSRCVACYNCVGACPENAIGYRFAWRPDRAAAAKKTPAPTAPAAATATPAASLARVAEAPATDPRRRGFIAAVALGAAGLVSVAPAAEPHGADGAPDEGGSHGPRRRRRHGHGRGDGEGGGSPVISPPGSRSIERLLELCTGCHLCVSACPTQVLVPAFLEYGWSGLDKPHMAYAHAFCNFDCRRCAEVCPTGAIEILALADKQLTRIGKARFVEDRCVVVANGTDCAACSEHCPTKAVETVPYRDNLRVPRVDHSLCIGCGACEYACPVKPVKAITVTGERVHSRAEKAVEKPAEAPAGVGDFPF